MEVGQSVTLPNGRKAMVTGVNSRGYTASTTDSKYTERFEVSGDRVKDVTPTALRAYRKERYKNLPVSEVSKVLEDDSLLSPKIDGSAAWLELLGDRAELLSYRPNAEGKPIVHTERANMQGLNPGGAKAVLRGELFFTDSKGKAVPVQRTSGLLNSTLGNSLKTQEELGLTPKLALFDVVEEDGKLQRQNPYAERLSRVSELTKRLKDNRLFVPETYSDPRSKRKLWGDISGNKYPLTQEGVVARYPDRTSKVKREQDADVYIRDLIEGQGKYRGSLGALSYSLDPEGPVVGRVGTGLSDADRREIYDSPKDYIGRMMSIKSEQQYPSGAYRAPRYRGLKML